MIELLFTPSNITFSLGLMAIIFSVYNYFRTPQIDGDKRDALFAQKLQDHIDSDALHQKAVQQRFDELLLLSSNHIHTVDTKVDVLGSRVSNLDTSITRLSTIIDERIPKKD